MIRHKRGSLWLAFLFLGLSALSLASCSGRVTEARSDLKSAEGDGGDWIELRQGVWIPVRDPFGQHLKSARLAFQNDALKQSASQLREAASILLRERPGLSDYGRSRLQSAAAELQDMAQRLEKDRVSATELDKALDKAYQAELENLWPLAESRTWHPRESEPEEHFVAAEEALERGDFKRASLEVGKSVALIRLEIGLYPLASHTKLEGALEELRMLSRDLENGTVREVRGLDHAFSRAHRELAAAHRLKAGALWTAGDGVRAGLELDALANHLEKALSRRGHRPGRSVETTLRDIRSLASKLVAGEAKPNGSADAEIQAIGLEIEQLEKAVSEQPAQPARR